MIVLSDKTPFASGGHKLVYRHPDFADRCLKVMSPEAVIKEQRADHDPLEEEWRGAEAVCAFGNSTVSRHMPAYYGFVATDIGRALCTEIICDSDGEISPTLEKVILREGYRDSVDSAVDEFLECFRSNFFSYDDLGLGNLLVKTLANGHQRIYYAEYAHERDRKNLFSLFRMMKRKKKAIKKMRAEIFSLLSRRSPPPVFVISLARAAERREDIGRRLDAANIRHEIVDAVDGAALDLSQLGGRYSEKAAAKKYGSPLLRGEIGCYLSHYNLWERIAAENIPAAVVLEDDTELDGDFSQVAAAVAACKWEWDVVLLYGSHMRRRYRALSPLCNGRELVQYARHVHGTVAYVVSCEGAKKLLSHCRDILEPIDVAWRDYWNWGGRFYAVRPFCVRCEVNADTSLVISEAKGMPKRRKKFQEKPSRIWDMTVRRLHAAIRPPKRKRAQ